MPRRRFGAANSADVLASLTMRDPGECSLQLSTMPRRRRAGIIARISFLMTPMPPELWLPRPVMISTSSGFVTCLARNHVSVRARASAADGRDSRRFSVRSLPNAASSRACQRAVSFGFPRCIQLPDDVFQNREPTIEIAALDDQRRKQTQRVISRRND